MRVLDRDIETLGRKIACWVRLWCDCDRLRVRLHKLDARRRELRLELKRHTPPTKARTVRTETRLVPRFEE